MIELFSHIFAFRRPTTSDHARALSKLGHEQQHERYRAKAQRIRQELGLPEHPALVP
jgi:hypothetical protein